MAYAMSNSIVPQELQNTKLQKYHPTTGITPGNRLLSVSSGPHW